MFQTIALGRLAVFSMLIALASQAIARADISPPDEMALHRVEITFHQAASTKDLNLIMSLFADDATLTAGGKTYSGKSAVRTYFAEHAGAFQPGNDWTAYTPAQRIRTSVDGDNATLYYECLYVDRASKTIKAHTFSDDTLVRSGDKWLIKTMKAGAVDQL